MLCIQNEHNYTMRFLCRVYKNTFTIIENNNNINHESNFSVEACSEYYVTLNAREFFVDSVRCARNIMNIINFKIIFISCSDEMNFL